MEAPILSPFVIDNDIAEGDEELGAEVPLLLR
jgi:hypothetical protein